MRRSSLLLVVLIIPPSTARGQWIPPLTEGVRIRLTAAVPEMSRQVGFYGGLLSDSLVLTLEKDSTVAAHPFNRVHGLEVYSGRGVSGKRVLRWASIGGGVGFLIGAVIGDASKPCDNCLDFTALTYAITGMAIGLAGGAIAGAAIPVDKWRRVELPAEYGFPQPLTKSFLASTPGQILMGVASILVLAAIN